MGSSARAPGEDDGSFGIKQDRKTRKPLVEKRRRARINESLLELRMLLADSELSAKMENAEVLEMTVKRVEEILQSRTQEAECVSEVSGERFSAGYIQCMHEVHTFLSGCPGLDASIAADLLSHLLECMPLTHTLEDTHTHTHAGTDKLAHHPTHTDVDTMPVQQQPLTHTHMLLMGVADMAPSDSTEEEEECISEPEVDSDTDASQSASHISDMWRPW